MACRCTKINKYISDVSRISDARASIQTLEGIDDALGTKLTDLSGYMNDMATPDSISACVAAIKGMNKGSSSSIGTMVGHCDTWISTLQNDLDMYKSEDREYHALSISSARR